MKSVRAVLLAAAMSWGGARADAEIRVSPSTVTLDSPEATQQVLVQQVLADGRTRDVSRSVRYQIVPPEMAVVDERGLLRPRAVGQGELVMEFENQRLAVPLSVQRLRDPQPVSFRNEIIPFFAKAIANRLWAHYFGRGLVDPIDDIRDTNPATNEPLMQALAEHMREVRFDLKAFTRTLLNSRVYQLTAAANSSNESDQQNFSHAAYKTLPAEVLLDAICQSTGVAEKFNGWPDGYRAIQVWDNRIPSYFFRIFGRPVRASVCECERSDEPSISQALHLLNAPEIAEKIAHRFGRARRLAASNLAPAELIDELYLATLTRYPTANEKDLMLSAFTHHDRRAATEDVLWALLNSKEFVFNH